jgi:uncharacterized protein involved in exopolysaccharide biosynthesis
LLEPAHNRDGRQTNYYGDDSDVDRLLSMAHSSQIIQKVIDEYDLATHYKIDAESNKGKIKLNKKFRKLYQIQKNEYDAIELSIEDKDPEMAKTLTDAVLSNVNQKAKEIVQASQRKMLDNLKITHAANVTQLTIVSDSLQRARKKYGIYNTKTQAEALTTLEIKRPNDPIVKKRIDNYSAGIAIVTNLVSLQNELNESIATDASEIQRIETSLSSMSTAIHLIEPAMVPIEKSRPRRSLYVLGAMMLVGLLSSLLVLIRDNLQSMTKT